MIILRIAPIANMPPPNTCHHCMDAKLEREREREREREELTGVSVTVS